MGSADGALPAGWAIVKDKAGKPTHPSTESFKELLDPDWEAMKATAEQAPSLKINPDDVFYKHKTNDTMQVKKPTIGKVLYRKYARKPDFTKGGFIDWLEQTNIKPEPVPEKTQDDEKLAEADPTSAQILEKARQLKGKAKITKPEFNIVVAARLQLQKKMYEKNELPMKFKRPANLNGKNPEDIRREEARKLELEFWNELRKAKTQNVNRLSQETWKELERPKNCSITDTQAFLSKTKANKILFKENKKVAKQMTKTVDYDTTPYVRNWITTKGHPCTIKPYIPEQPDSDNLTGPGSPNATLRLPIKSDDTIRVLQFNILAHGLSGDGGGFAAFSDLYTKNTPKQNPKPAEDYVREILTSEAYGNKEESTNLKVKTTGRPIKRTVPKTVPGPIRFPLEPMRFKRILSLI